MKKLILGIVALSLFIPLTRYIWATDTSSKGPIDPLNIILIMTDDQRWDAREDLYMPKLKTEMIDRGITFINHFATTPLCCPSRASQLTGKYAHRHGVFTNQDPNGGYLRFDPTSTVATWLQVSGYKTALIGKYLNGYTEEFYQTVPPGWDRWFGMTKTKYLSWSASNWSAAVPPGPTPTPTLVRYATTTSDYSTDVLKGKAINFIRTHTTDPFFMMVTPFAPHSPYDPADRHEGTLIIDNWRPPSYNEEDVSDKPPWIKRLPKKLPSEISYWDGKRRAQLETLMAVDDLVGDIFVELRAQNLEDNTVVIFTSDNGFSWGEHRWFFLKDCPYEECLRIPLVIYHPDFVRPRTEERLTLNIDIPLTIASIGRASPTIKTNGTTLMPLINNTATQWRSDMLFEHWEIPQILAPDFEGVRNSKYKYTKYTDPVNRGEELYDLVNDPYELTNKASDPAYLDIKNQLIQRLAELKIE